MNALLAIVNGALLWLSGFPVAESCSGWHAAAGQSHLRFLASFEGAEAPGEFHRFAVCLAFDPDRPTGGHLEVRVDMTSVDMDSVDLNEAVAEAEWFDVGGFPEARFFSKRIEPAGVDRFVARGTLTLKGTARPVDVPFAWHDAGGAKSISGELELQRAEFDIGSGEWASSESIGQAVIVQFDVALESGP